MVSSTRWATGVRPAGSLSPLGGSGAAPCGALATPAGPGAEGGGALAVLGAWGVAQQARRSDSVVNVRRGVMVPSPGSEEGLSCKDARAPRPLHGEARPRPG